MANEHLDHRAQPCFLGPVSRCGWNWPAAGFMWPAFDPVAEFEGDEGGSTTAVPDGGPEDEPEILVVHLGDWIVVKHCLGFS